MTKKEIAPDVNGNANQCCAPPDNAVKDRKIILTAKRLETVVAVLLGITTLLSAWASWGFVDRSSARRFTVNQLYTEQQLGVRGDRTI